MGINRCCRPDTMEKAHPWTTALLASSIIGGAISPIAAFTWIYSDILRETNGTTVQTGLVGSTALSACYLASPVALLVEGVLGLHMTVILSSTLAMVSIFVSSFMTSFWGLLLTFGVAYGTMACLALHSTFCVLFRYFDRSKRSNASGFVYAGVSVSNIVLSLLYERLVGSLGWRLTLRFTALYTLVLSVPSSFLMRPRKADKVRMRHVSRQVDVNAAITIKKKDRKEEEEDVKGECSVQTVCEKVEGDNDVETRMAPYLPEDPRKKPLLRMFTSLTAWMIFFAVFLPGMAWTAYWTNIVSYFESLSLSEAAILVNVTILTGFELLGRLSLAIFIDKLPFREVNVLVIMNITFVIVTSLFALWPTEIVLLICSAFIGVGRGCAIVLPYNATAELLKGYSVDHAVTLTMLAIGAGFAVGVIPTGAVYDATDSYSLAFIINALFFLVGAMLLVLLKVLRRCRKNRRRRRLNTKSAEAAEPSANLGYDVD